MKKDFESTLLQRFDEVENDIDHKTNEPCKSANLFRCSWNNLLCILKVEILSLVFV